MRVTRRPFVTVAAALAIAAGWNAYRSAEREIAVLRTFDLAGRDYYATVWVADDPHGFVWLRAHRPDHKWLAAIHQRPDVELSRAERSRRYSARIIEDGATQRHVARLFREKYGLADRLRELTATLPPTPIRLEPR